MLDEGVSRTCIKSSTSSSIDRSISSIPTIKFQPAKQIDHHTTPATHPRVHLTPSLRTLLLLLTLLGCFKITLQQEPSSIPQDHHHFRKIPSRTIATSRRWTSSADKYHPFNHDPSDQPPRLRTRSSNPAPTNQGISKTCSTYYSANTNHAVCDGDRTMMCIAGCTGGIIAQNCQSNSSSPLTTQTCSVAFSQTSNSAYLCNTPEGAFTCSGPSSGNIACRQCISTPNGVLPPNINPEVIIPTNSNSTTGSSNNVTNEHNQDGSTSSSDSSTIKPSHYKALFKSKFTSTCLMNPISTIILTTLYFSI